MAEFIMGGGEIATHLLGARNDKREAAQNDTTLSLRASTCRGVAILLAKFQIPKSKLQTNPNIKIQNPKRFEHWYFVL
jgi:hypothetical protein